MENYQFVKWQNLYIESLKYGHITINQAIRYFIKDGLIPFITKNKYIFEFHPHIIENTIASMMFRSSKNKIYLFPTRDGISFNDEYYDYYQYLIDDDKWKSFWTYWNNQLDKLFDYTNDKKIALEIQSITWMFIDLEKSKAYEEYNESLGDLENTETYTVKIDPYILDQMNSNNHPKFIRFENK